MFKCTISGITCRFSLLFPAALLCLLKMDTSGVVLFCYCAAFLHESAHGVALCLLRLKPQVLTVSFFGMRLDLPPSYEWSLAQTVIVASREKSLLTSVKAEKPKNTIINI